MKRILAMIAAIAVLLGAIVVLRETPSNQRDWSPDQAVLAYAERHGPLVTKAYYDKIFDLRKLDAVWFFVEPFVPSRIPDSQTSTLSPQAKGQVSTCAACGHAQRRY